MNVDNSGNETLSSTMGFGTVQILGIVFLIVGLLIAVAQTRSIVYNQSAYDQTALLGDLCWIAVGIAIELLGIGLIALGKRK